MKKLFTLSGLCAVDFLIGGIRYSCCGRVNLVRREKSEIGYIMEEKDGKWKVQMGNNKVIIVPRVRRMYDDHGNFIDYMYDNINQRKWIVNMYWPIRMKFNVNSVENWQYMLNRIVTKNGKIVHQISS